MDGDNANKVLLELPIKESNMRVAMSSEIPPDDISRVDELVLDVVGASCDQFDVK